MMLETVATQSSVTLDSESMMTPGVKQQCTSELTSFLKSAANKAANLVPEGVAPKDLSVEELKSLVAVAESTDRVIDSFSYSDKGDQLIFIRLRNPRQ